MVNASDTVGYGQRVDRAYVGTHFEDLHVNYQSHGKEDP